jgi:hypothetical protein
LNWVLDMTYEEMFQLVKNTAVSVPSLAQARIDILTASNPLAAWLDDCCIFDPKAQTQIGIAVKQTISVESGGDRLTRTEYQNSDIWLYASYRSHCDQVGCSKPVSMRVFGRDLLDLCRNQLKNRDVTDIKDRNGKSIVGIRLRGDSDVESASPMSVAQTPEPPTQMPQETQAQPQSVQTPEEVWASIDPSLIPDVHTMVQEVWSYADKDDRDFMASFSDWFARHSTKSNWEQLRAETWRYLKSTDDGRTISRRLQKIGHQQTHSSAA